MRGLPGPGNLRTPLEGVDLAADLINRAATLVPTVVSEVGDSASRIFSNLKADIESPRQQSERPIPPDKLIGPFPDAIGHVVTGAIDTVKSGMDAVVDNVEGARREIEDFVRR